MSDWKQRLCGDLEPILRQPNPLPAISSYHDMPYAIFRYEPEDEFAVRQELTLLKTRLEQAGKRVTEVSLAECMDAAMRDVGMTPERVAQAERRTGVTKMVETVHKVLSQRVLLEDLVADRIPSDATPDTNVVFITRAGALFPIYRTSSLLEQLKGKVHVPAVLFYPGHLDGAAGLKFMGVLDAEHNYRPKIF